MTKEQYAAEIEQIDRKIEEEQKIMRTSVHVGTQSKESLISPLYNPPIIQMDDSPKQTNNQR